MSRPAYDSAHHRHPGPTADQVSWTVVGVFGDNEMPATGPGPMTRFAYTVGLADVVGFELWSSCMSENNKLMDFRWLTLVLNQIGWRLSTGELAPGDVYREPTNYAEPGGDTLDFHLDESPWPDPDQLEAFQVAPGSDVVRISWWSPLGGRKPRGTTG